MITLHTFNRQTKVQTSLPGVDFFLQSVDGWEGLSADFDYSAVLLSLDDSVVGSQLVGKPITVAYRSETGYVRYINGIVNRFEYLGQRAEIDGQPFAGYKVNIVPWFWLLKNNTDCEIFQKMKAPEIIKKIFKDLGFTDFRFALNESYANRNYCVQYNESDYDFVSRLMEEEGIFYYFKHSNGKHEMVITDSVSGYFELEDSAVKYTPVGQSHFENLSGWQHVHEFRPGRVSQKDFNFEHPRDRLITQDRSNAKYSNNELFEVYQYPGKYLKDGVGNRLTRIRREQLDAEHEVVEGSGFYPSFSPGGKFEVTEHQRSMEVGKSYVITSVHTSFSADYGFDGDHKTDFSNMFRCIPGETVYRPPMKTNKPVIEGTQTAVVVTNSKDDDDILVDGHARVKVQFHWDRYGKQNARSSCWIRVSQVHAGKGWGMIDIPRKNEEVIVSFLDGDPDRPIIIGRVYNGDNQAPFGMDKAADNSKNKTRRGNTTKSYKQGGYNEMTMDDTAGEEQIRIHSQHNMDTTVQNDQTLTVNNNRTKTIAVDETNDIGNNRSTTVGVDHTENVGNNQNVTVSTNQSTTVGANQSISVGSSQTTSVGSNQTNTVGMARNEMIGVMSNEIVGAVKTVSVGASLNTAVGATNTEQVGMKKSTIVGGTYHIDAGSKFEVTCGASKLTMDAGGKITIEGTEILMGASGPVKINGAVIDLN